jgi:exopolysaccharide biosynthesis operon protein EpsL
MYARRRWALACIAFASAAAQAAFDPTDTVQIHASVGYVRDSNLFRLPDIDPRLFGINPENKSDTALIKGVGLKFDKLVSRQRIIAEANFSENTYDKNTNLDFVGSDGRAAWLWQVGNYWSGDLSFRKRRQLGGFADLQQNIQDLVDTDSFSLSAGYRFHPRWRVVADLRDEETTHGAANRRTLNSEFKSAGLTLTYQTPADNTIGMEIRQADRAFPNRTTIGLLTFDNGHRETRVNAIVGWRMSGALRLDAQAGHIDVKHDQLSQRDFSGATWRAGATWDASGKVRVALNGSRDVRLYEDIVTSYIVANALSITPTYAITSKIIVQGDFSYERRDFRGDPGFVPGAVQREDNLRIGRLILSYTPVRNLDLSLSFDKGERRANLFTGNFEYRSWFGSIRASF